MKRFLLLAAVVAAFCIAVPFGSLDAQAKKAEQKKKDPPAKKQATEPADLFIAPGFQVELVHTADPATEGSFINLAKDGKGRLIVSGQRGQPILRFTLADGKVVKEEKLELPLSEAMGLLWAFDHLYINAAGPEGFGLYKCKEEGDTGKFKEVKFLKAFQGAGEHGPHGMAVGPDNKIYVMNGNHTKLPDGVSPYSPYKNYKEDHLLPRQWDGNGHAAGIYAPGGYVVRTDAEGKDWELVLGSFRNAYDIAFNGDGELFTFDSDMEWDWGMPWYRPTRVNHCVSGADYGWRSGTGVWPDSYPDSLPTTLDVGVGSPTGVTTGKGAKFPAKYQKALFILDWTYGRLFAVHLTPKGSTYEAVKEVFVAPKGIVDGNSPKKPLNLTDAVIGDDGALYFTIGGRNTQAALYRVTYTGKESTAPAKLDNDAGKAERDLRHKIEAFHGKPDPKAVETVWQYLDSPDRFLRNAARIAVETQPVAEWRAKAVAETKPEAGLQALLALARSGEPKDQAAIFEGLAKWPLDTLTDDQKLEKLRTVQVAISRLGRPSVEWSKKIIAKLDPKFPGANELVNRELAQILIYLHAPGIADKVLKHMAAAKTQEDMMHYLFHLRTLPIGNWTMDQRKEYFAYWTAKRDKFKHPELTEKWFAEAARPYSDGNSFANFMKNFLREAVSNLSDSERKALEPQLSAIDKATVVSYDVKPRAFVKAWKTEELMPILAKAEKGRSFEKGREAFIAAQCVKCHRVGAEGGGVGPDLTAIASRFQRKDLLESITEPSKVISDQYQNEQFTTTGGKTVTGRLVDENADSIWVQPDPLQPERVQLKRKEIEERRPSKLSPMPEKLIDVLTEEEILDMLAFIESGGTNRGPAFSKKK